MKKNKKFNKISIKVLCTVPENKKLVEILFIRAFYIHIFALLWDKKVKFFDVLLSMSRGEGGLSGNSSSVSVNACYE